MPFYTEKRQEELLEQEHRILELPGGDAFECTMYNMYWASFDVITRWDHMSPEFLVQKAQRWAGHGKTAQDIFPNVVWSYHDWFHNKLGVDTGLEVPPRPALMYFSRP